MPGDLNLKKSWNPALVKNQAKVWQQEQKTLEEYKNIKKREEELAKEKESFELLALKNKHNDSLTAQDKLKLNKLDWMYDAPVANSSHENKSVPQATQEHNSKANNLSNYDPKLKVQKPRVKELKVSKEVASLDPMLKMTAQSQKLAELDPMLRVGRAGDMDSVNVDRKRERSPSRSIHSERERNKSRPRHRRHSSHREHEDGHKRHHKPHKHHKHRKESESRPIPY